MSLYYWRGLSGNWSISGDWLEGAAPGPADSAIFSVPGPYAVDVTASEVVNSLFLEDPNASVEIQTGGTLAVGGVASIQSGLLAINAGGILTVGAKLAVQSGGVLELNGGVVDGGALVVQPGGVLQVSTGAPVPSVASDLDDVTVLGGLTLSSGTLLLSGGTSVETKNGQEPALITLGGNSILGLGESYTFHALALEGGYVAADSAQTATIAAGGLVHGYGGFIFGPYGDLTLDNYGTIVANVAGEWLNIEEMPFVNNGLILANGGGELSIDYEDPYFDPWSNGSSGTIRVVDGGTLELGSKFTNYGEIESIGGTVDFGDVAEQPGFVNNAGQLLVSGGSLFIGSTIDVSWTNGGLISATCATTTLNGGGVNTASGTLLINGGELEGQATLENGGELLLRDSTVALSSIVNDATGRIAGYGSIAAPIANSGTVVASGGTLDVSAAISGSGQLRVACGATLELGGPTAQNVTFNATGGLLALDNADDFTGDIAALKGADAVDLRNFAYANNPIIANITGSEAAGALVNVTISDGGLSDTIHLLNQFAGQYSMSSGAYQLVSDQSGSTQPGSLFMLAPKAI